MATVAEILQTKGSQVQTIAPSATVLEATMLMNRHQIGSLVVVEGGRVVGIFTERDVLRRVVAAEKQPSKITVGEVMTRQVLCCSPEADMDEVRELLRERRIRHLPVCDARGGLLGLVSIGDVNAYYASQQKRNIEMLHSYIYGRA